MAATWESRKKSVNETLDVDVVLALVPGGMSLSDVELIIITRHPLSLPSLSHLPLCSRPTFMSGISFTYISAAMCALSSWDPTAGLLLLLDTRKKRRSSFLSAPMISAWIMIMIVFILFLEFLDFHPSAIIYTLDINREPSTRLAFIWLDVQERRSDEDLSMFHHFSGSSVDENGWKKRIK